MDLLTAILLGALQGVLEFFPVSSSGHLVILEQLTGFQGQKLPFHVFVHLGSALAVLIVLRRDCLRLLVETGRMARDLLKNLKEFFRGVRRGEDPDYSKVVRTNYRKLVVMLLLSSVPTALIGFFLRGAAEELSHSVMYTGVGLLLTGIALIVASMLKPGEELPRDIPGWKVLLMGVAQGISVLPGISRYGVTVCGGILSGMSLVTSIRISLLMLVPTSVGAFLAECVLPGGIPSCTGTELLMGLMGLAASAVTGTLLMKRIIHFVRIRKLTGFAYYCFCLGLFSVLLGFLL